MNLSTRLDRVIAAVLAAGCAGLGTKDGTELDDVACLNVEVGTDCPDEATASGELVGNTTCETPVREVIATGAFVSSEDVVYTGYGGWDSPGDSGVPDTAAVTTRCCYEAAYEVHEGEGCVIGRPVLVDGAPLTAPTVARAGWGGGDVGEGPLDEEAAAYWARQGALEHASVAAFGRLVLDLLRLGAPASLVDRAGEALRDEVRHAQLCYALAARFGGSPVGPGPLPVPAGRSRTSLVRLATAAWREGCLGETGSVGVAAAQLAGATDGPVRAVVAGILADEARHAALSWDLVAWAIEAGGERVRRAVARERARIRVPDDVGSERAAARGVPERDRVTHALALVEREVVGPARAALLAA